MFFASFLLLYAFGRSLATAVVLCLSEKFQNSFPVGIVTWNVFLFLILFLHSNALSLWQEFKCLSIFCPFSFQVTIQGEWALWQSKVPQIEVETHKVAAPDIVVPTVDTVRHEALLYTWLAEHKPMVLCGPPGSGKTMTLFSALRALPDMEVGTTWFKSKWEILN